MKKVLKINPNQKTLVYSGFTLIEVLVASAILVILAFGFLGLQYIIGQNQVSVWRNYLSIDDANSSISSLSKELRNARQSATGGYLLETANNNEIVFYSDIDYDGIVERVRYTLSGSRLVKGVIKPSGTPISYPSSSEKVKTVSNIVRNGSAALFRYYNANWPQDQSGNPLPQAQRISATALIRIYLRTNPNATKPDQDYILETDVRLRMKF